MKITKKLLILWAMLISICAPISAQTWTWTGETWASASTKYYLRQASSDRYVTGDNKIVTDHYCPVKVGKSIFEIVEA